jgi:peptidoglycan/xylan/chitin deacetylase (PgdA/CDA1 family)
MSQDGLCADMNLVKQRFEKLTGGSLDPIWRAPGGKVSSQYIQMGEVCGYRHVGWSKSGFLGDELSSEKFPNQQLLKKALAELKPGDIAMAHLGIWSRKDPWAPAVLEPLIVGLKKKGYCFDTILGLQQHSEISRIIKP